MEFKDELIRLQGLLDAQTGKVREPKPYPIDKITYGLHIHDAGRPSYSQYGNSEPTPSLALSRAEKAYEESKLLVEENRVICAENKRIVNFLLDSIKNAGIPSRVEVIISEQGEKNQARISGCSVDETRITSSHLRHMGAE